MFWSLLHLRHHFKPVSCPATTTQLATALTTTQPLASAHFIAMFPRHWLTVLSTSPQSYPRMFSAKTRGASSVFSWNYCFRGESPFNQGFINRPIYVCREVETWNRTSANNFNSDWRNSRWTVSRTLPCVMLILNTLLSSHRWFSSFLPCHFQKSIRVIAHLIMCVN